MPKLPQINPAEDIPTGSPLHKMPGSCFPLFQINVTVCSRRRIWSILKSKGVIVFSPSNKCLKNSFVLISNDKMKKWSTSSLSNSIKINLSLIKTAMAAQAVHYVHIHFCYDTYQLFVMPSLSNRNTTPPSAKTHVEKLPHDAYWTCF